MAIRTLHDARAAFDARYGDDPVGFAQDVLGVELWSRQRDILRSVFQHRRTVVPSGHGVGKTFVAAVAVMAFLWLRRPSKVITSAPTWRQVETILWAEITRLAITLRERVAMMDPPDALTTRLRISPDHFAIGVSSDDPAAFHGYHAPHVLVILDEAAGIVERDKWVAIDSLTSTGDAHILAIGNPTASSGQFFDACRSGWNRIRISCLDSPNFTDEPVSENVRRHLVTPEWVEEKRHQWGEDSPLFASRVLGEFPREDDRTLIPLAWVDAAQQRVVVDNGRPRLLGVDVARFGSDQTVYVGVFGGNAVILGHDTGRDTMQVAGRAAALAREHGIETIAIDDIGVGGGVTDRLRELDLSARIIGVNVGEAAVDSERFANRRTELWWLLREWIRDTGQIPDDDLLLADLTSSQYVYTSRGQLRLEPKEETRKRLGRSPDYGDALMLTFAARAAQTASWFGSLDLRGGTIATAFPQ